MIVPHVVLHAEDLQLDAVSCGLRHVRSIFVKAATSTVTTFCPPMCNHGPHDPSHIWHQGLMHAVLNMVVCGFTPKS